MGWNPPGAHEVAGFYLFVWNIQAEEGECRSWVH